jgi:hypothetical protein
MSEVVVGNIAYFDHQLLIDDQFIDCGDLSINRPGPFVCVEVKGDDSVWCAITTQFKRERLFIDQAWRQDGSPLWHSSDQYLQDGLKTYFGPSTSFVVCAQNEMPFQPHLRPKISQAGVQAILAEINAQGGPLLP